MLRLVVVFLVLCAVLSVVRGLFAGASKPARRTPAGPRQTGGRLVKDPVCGTYVAEETAVRAQNEFFCSEDCRQKFRGQSR